MLSLLSQQLQEPVFVRMNMIEDILVIVKVIRIFGVGAPFGGKNGGRHTAAWPVDIANPNLVRMND